jgi:hypothetical protein
MRGSVVLDPSRHAAFSLSFRLPHAAIRLFRNLVEIFNRRECLHSVCALCAGQFLFGSPGSESETIAHVVLFSAIAIVLDRYGLWLFVLSGLRHI